HFQEEEEVQDDSSFMSDGYGEDDTTAARSLEAEAAETDVGAEDFAEAVSDQDLKAAERNSEADLEEEFPDLDLEYRLPDEGDDPARPGKQAGEEEEADPFSRWEEEALEQAEQEAKSLRAEDDRATQEQSFLYEDIHPMTTLPAEAHIASQRKIDHYMALFDLLRELQDVQELEEFWDSLAYALLGQLAAGKVLIFAPQESGKDKPFYPVASLGISPPEAWVLQPGQEIYDTLAKSPEIHYAQEFQKPTSTISDVEKSILEKGSVQVLAPIGQQGRMEGLIFLGANMEGVDYSLDDLEYLKLLGEMSSGALQRIRQRVKREEQAERNEARVTLYERILNASHEASQVKNLDDVYDVLLSHLKEDFGVQSASLVLLNVQQQEYRIFAGNEISPESLERFRLPVGSELIGTISNLTRLYDFASFRENQEITSCYSNDDLALMQNYWIIPLINLNWLVGFITIHRTSRPWSEFDRELVLATSEFFAPILANSIILGERETLFRDPFSPVVERLKKELNRAAQFQTPVSLVEVRVKNLKRLLSLNEPDSVTGFLQDLSRSLSGLLFDSDFLARVGQGRFALILPGRNRQEAEIFVRKIQAEFKRLNLLARSPVDVQYSFQSVTAPEEADEAEKMLAYLDP
ncbi:MAG: diguanylate cyclase, partial [Leptospiraceae bacterium]|nr:diguanylate cyclase [Leptospiraceae bacterium]